ncbi:hypothetical protein EWM64_g2917 [Hericium alpestre]|uniref:F-box domain-containing protein n=1 Tax=Hericium alpestre TaxID=135208 RepID=A0A4Z0A4C7_9AGAM|nr:hypothetical protein EWM64_g2917 [Hericium alpestre]
MEAIRGGAPMLSLPTEITISVFRKAKLKTLLRCAQVCRYWYMLVRDNLELQYQIELEAHGVQDNCPIEMSLVERLQLLRRKQIAWRTGTAGDMLSVMKLPRSAPTTWAFNGNSIAYVDEAARMVHYKQLGADSVSAEDCMWPLPDMGASLTLSLDPDQDLLAIASLDTVMLSIHSATLAEDGRSSSPFTNFRRIATSGLRQQPISGRSPASISDTAVWNWKTGVLQKRIGGPRTNMEFVTNDLGMMWDPRISINNGFAGGLVVHVVQKNASALWSLSGQDYNYALLMPSFLFEFPDFGRHEVRIYSPHQTHHQSSVFPPALDADHLIILDTSEFNELFGMRTRRLLISHSKLVAKLQKRRDNRRRHVLPWDEWKACVVWASEKTRRDVFEPQMTAGMRYVEQAPPSMDDSSTSFDILDFEPRRAARAMSAGAYPGESLVHTSCFSNDELVVRHPYLSRRVKVRLDPRSWLSAHLITDEGLFVVSPNISPTGIQNGILTVSVVPFAENIENPSS